MKRIHRGFKICLAIFCAIIVAAMIPITIFLIVPSIQRYGDRRDLAVYPVDEINGGDYIHFLNTGSSDAILLESQGHYALIDAGEDSDNPRGFENLEAAGYENQVLDYLKTYAAGEDGKVYLDFVLGTHSHSDHIGGFDTIIRDPDVTIEKAYLKVYDSSTILEKEVEEWDNQEVYNQMLDALTMRGVPVISQMDQTPFSLGNFTITLFNTEDYDTEKVGENDHSIGLLVEKEGTRVFLSGDIDNISGDEERLAPQIGAVDLLKIGHHSYAYSTSVQWLKTLNPKVCVITNSPDSVYPLTLCNITRITRAPILITGAEDGVVAQIGSGGDIQYFNHTHGLYGT